MAFLHQICKSFLDLLYPLPNVCPLCRQNPKSGGQICLKCERELQCWQGGPESWTTFPVVKSRKTTGPYYQALYAAAPYRGVYRQAIQSLKYGRQAYLAKVLGELMARHLQAKANHPFDLIVPVPLAARKEVQRGFNQSRLLAEVLSHRFSVPLEDKLLLKNRETKAQARLDKNKRLENLKGAFAVTRSLPNSPCILLVDDIFTTGATVQEAAATLCKAGAGRVEVVVWAKSIGY